MMGDFFTLEKKKRKKRLSYTAPPILCPRFWVQYILIYFYFPYSSESLCCTFSSFM